MHACMSMNMHAFLIARAHAVAVALASTGMLVASELVILMSFVTIVEF